MVKLLNWIKVQKKLKEKGLLIFRPWDIVRLFGVSKAAIGSFMYRNAKKGLLIRLKKSQAGGLYALADNLPSQYLIANRIYEPSYISFDAALSFHGVIPETIYSITSATPKATREFAVAGIIYQYFLIKKEIYVGYRPIRYRDSVVLMAEAEKALADYLYFVDLKKRDLHYERIDLQKIKRHKLIKYIKLYKRPKMLALVERIYADFRKPKRIY
jgi:predicted transcriptional regulator of viral defense system